MYGRPLVYSFRIRVRFVVGYYRCMSFSSIDSSIQVQSLLFMPMRNSTRYYFLINPRCCIGCISRSWSLISSPRLLVWSFLLRVYQPIRSFFAFNPWTGHLWPMDWLLRSFLSPNRTWSLLLSSRPFIFQASIYCSLWPCPSFSIFFPSSLPNLSPLHPLILSPFSSLVVVS